MPLIGGIGMCRWGNRCGACVVLVIHGEARVNRNGCGRRVSSVGRRLVGLWGFGVLKNSSELTGNACAGVTAVMRTF